MDLPLRSDFVGSKPFLGQRTKLKVSSFSGLEENTNQATENHQTNQLPNDDENAPLRMAILRERTIIDSSSPGRKIIGNENVMHAIEDSFIAIRSRPANKDVACDKSFLLVGIPGVGKTEIMKSSVISAANLIKCPISMFIVKSSLVTSKWLGQSERLVTQLYQIADAYGPSVLFFDEVDGIVRARSDDEQDSARRFKTNMLSEMQGLNRYTKVVTVAATNRPWELDSAFLRRFDRKFVIRLPTPNERVEIFKEAVRSRIPNEVLSFSRIDFANVQNLTDGCTGDEIVKAVKNASQTTFKRQYRGILVEKDQYDQIQEQIGLHDSPVEGTWTDLTISDIVDKGLRTVKPTTIQKDCEKIEDWAQKNIEEYEDQICSNEESEKGQSCCRRQCTSFWCNWINLFCPCIPCCGSC